MNSRSHSQLHEVLHSTMVAFFSAGGGGTGAAMAGMGEAKTTCSLQKGTRQPWVCYGGSKRE